MQRAVQLDDLKDVNPTYSRGGMKFSRHELRDIVISMAFLIASFTIIYIRGINTRYSNYWEIVLFYLGLSTLFVVTAFLCHEMAHKYVAQKYGAWSEFRMFLSGLLFCLIFSFTGFLFAAPGAVMISGRIDKEEYGRISLAGPAVNFFIAGLAILFVLVSGINGLVASILMMMAYLNAFLGIFNMIPIPPLDGSKVIRWSVPAYLLTVFIGIAEVAFVYWTLWL